MSQTIQNHSDIAKFAEKHIIPNSRSWDENQNMPKEFFKKLGEKGFLGILVPDEYGGQGKNHKFLCDIISGISKYDSSIGLAIASQNCLSTSHILKFGTESQKKYWLPQLSKGQKVGAWALTEHKAGSDVSKIQTFAREESGNWVINGKKTFITNGGTSDVIILMARTNKGITAFLVEKDRAGVAVGKKIDKLGMRALDTTELIFQDCIIPRENIIGEEGLGFRQAMQVLEVGRLSLSALSIGIARRALDVVFEHTTNREQFGKKLIDFQGISFRIADLWSRVKAAELLTYDAAYLKDQNKNINLEASMSKLLTSELAVECSDFAVQALGKYGYSKDYPAEKLYRDSKICTIGEGTTEIQKIIISKELVKRRGEM